MLYILLFLYRWLKNRAKPTSRQLISVKIKEVIEDHPDNINYGIPRMKTALEQYGITVSKRTVSRAMSEMGLIHKNAFRIVKRLSRHKVPR